MIDRKELKRKLPQGYCKVVANRAGVTQKSVSSYFGYRNNSEKIENTILKVLGELKREKEELLRGI